MSQTYEDCVLQQISYKAIQVFQVITQGDPSEWITHFVTFHALSYKGPFNNLLTRYMLELVNSNYFKLTI